MPTPVSREFCAHGETSARTRSGSPMRRESMDEASPFDRRTEAHAADACPLHPEGSRLQDSEDAFTAIVRPLLDELVRIARRQLACDHLAWEAVQDALVGLWRRSDVPENPRAWLIRAVLFRSLHIRRTTRRRHKHEGAACCHRREAVDRDEPSNAVIITELRDEVWRALGKLNERHREVLSLHLIEGLEYEHIARRLRVPLGTVRSRLSRARDALKSRLAVDFQDLN